MKKLLLTLLCLFLTACAPKPKDNHLNVVLDWLINPDHAPLFVALHDGFFKQQNLDVTILNLADPNDGPKLVAAGKADIAITYEPRLLIEQKQGLPLMQIGTLVNQPLDCLSVPESSHIKTLKDLEGKSIASSSTGVDALMLHTMLAFNHVPIKDVEQVNVRYNLVSALMSGKVNAASGFMRNVEPIQMALLGKATRNFYPEDNGVPPYAELIWVSHNNLIDKKQKEMQRFMLALQNATAYLKTHPQKTWIQFAKAYPELNTSFNHDSWMATIHYFDDTPGVLDVAQTERFEKFLNQTA